MSKIFVSNMNEGQWQKSSAARVASGANPHLRWQHLVDSTQNESAGISMGMLCIPTGEDLPPHRHAQQEVYFILKGDALLIMDDGQTRALAVGETVYIPGNALHGIQNTGDTDFELLWIFPTDSWHDVEYTFGA